MRKLKIISLLWLALLVTFLYLDYKCYYYGFGYGFISPKIPNRFEIVFAGSDLGNQGILIQESYASISVVEKNNTIYLNNSNNEIYVKKLLGYWFNQNTIIAKIRDDKNKKRYIEIFEEATNALHPKYFYNEMRYPPGEWESLNYINLDKDLTYFGRFRAVKNLVFIVLLFLSLHVLRLAYGNWKRKNMLLPKNRTS